MNDEPRLVFNAVQETGAIFRITHKEERVIYFLKGKEVEPDTLVAHLMDQVRALEEANKTQVEVYDKLRSEYDELRHRMDGLEK